MLLLTKNVFATTPKERLLVLSISQMVDQRMPLIVPLKWIVLRMELGQRSARPILLHSIINAKVMQSIEEVQIDREEDYNESSYEMSSALIT